MKKKTTTLGTLENLGRRRPWLWELWKKP